MIDQIPLLEETRQIQLGREHWHFRGQQRPDFADKPLPGQRSVWDFPRPPAIEVVEQPLTVFDGETLVAETLCGVRVLETAGAPTYYFPPDDVKVALSPSGGNSICEWKGMAESLTVAGIPDAAWRYVRMFPAFRELYRWVAFYPTKLDCRVGEEQVTPQPGGYYGGWVTRDLAGPIKGEPGTGHW